MDEVIVSAPGKLMLFGEQAVVWGYPCLVTAVDTRVVVKLEKIKEKKIRILAPQVGVVDFLVSLSVQGRTLYRYKVRPYTKGIEFIESAVVNFSCQYHLTSGLSINIQECFSNQYGLGSSSAVTVAVIYALGKLFGRRLSKKELFKLSYQSVLDVQGIGSGFDVAAAVWGGTIYFRRSRCNAEIEKRHPTSHDFKSRQGGCHFVTGGKKIVPVKAGKLPLAVAYSGNKADTPTMIRKVQRLRSLKFKLVESTFGKIKAIVEKGRQLLEEKNWQELGRLMGENQKLLVKLGISTPKINKLVTAASKAGAWGAKLSGAGGGDCIIALVDSAGRLKVERALEKAGGTIINVKTGAEGVKVE